MCKKYLLYKSDTATGRQFITWLMAGSRREALDFISWFKNLNPQNTLFRLEEGESFELIEEQLELQESIDSMKEVPESAIA